MASKTYLIRYNTGAGDFKITGMLWEAKKAADEGAAYTQEDICIYEIVDGDEKIVCRRAWWGYEYDEDNEDEWCENPICFGSFGHYGDWSDEAF